MQRNHSPRRSQRNGATTVEFALTFGAFLLMSFAVFEFSRVSMLRHTADNAAYEGARFAIVPGATAEEAEQAAREILDLAEVQFASISVQPNPLEEDSTSIRVRVELPITQNSWVAPRFLNGRSIVSDVSLLTERAPQVLSQGLQQ